MHAACCRCIALISTLFCIPAVPWSIYQRRQRKEQERRLKEQQRLKERKNELDEGGRKAATRSWKNYYSVLIGPLLNFYKDKRDFQQYISACPPINVTQGVCEAARDYQKRKNALRLKLPNGAEYLFLARDESDVMAWVQAINSVIQGGGSAPPSSVSSAVSSPPLSQIGSPTHSVEPPLPSWPAEPQNGSAGSKPSSDALDLPPDSEPPPLPSVPLPEEEPVSKELPIPAAPAAVKPQPSPSLPSAHGSGHHRHAPPPPPTSVAPPTASVAPPTLVPPPTQDEGGKADKAGKKKSRFKMFGAKKS